MFGREGRSRRVDLCDWTHHDELPPRTQLCDVPEQVEIEPLVQHTEEPNPRLGNAFLIRGLWQRLTCESKMRNVDAAGTLLDIPVECAFGFVQTATARQDEICPRQERRALSL